MTPPRRCYEVPPPDNRLMTAWLKRELDAIYEEEWRAADREQMNRPPGSYSASSEHQTYLKKKAIRLARDHGDLEQLHALYPELKDLLKRPDRPEGHRFHPNKFREVMKEVWGNTTLARVVQDAARIRKLWLDHFGWGNRRSGYWPAERFAAERRIEEEHLPRSRVRAHRLEARARQLRKELIKVGVPKDELRQIFGIIDLATTPEDETPAPWPPFIPI